MTRGGSPDWAGVATKPPRARVIQEPVVSRVQALAVAWHRAAPKRRVLVHTLATRMRLGRPSERARATTSQRPTCESLGPDACSERAAFLQRVWRTHLRGDIAWCLACTYEASDQTEYASCLLAALIGSRIGIQASRAAALRCRTCTMPDMYSYHASVTSAASGDASSVV